MKLQELLIVIVLIGAIVGGLYGFLSDVADEYGVDVDDEQYTTIYENTQILATDINDAHGNLTSGTTSTAGQFWVGINLVWSVVKSLVTLPITILIAVVNSVAITLGFPAWVLGTILSTLTIWVVFSLMGWARGWKE